MPTLIVLIGPTGVGKTELSPVSYTHLILEDKVDIGANTCVDRATMGATIIHSGAKIDNLVQIAHNDEIGSHTVMAVSYTHLLPKWRCRRTER